MKSKRFRNVQQNFKLKKISYFLFFPVSIFFMEMVISMRAFETLLLWGVVYTLLFSAAIGIFIIAVCSMFNGSARFIMMLVSIVFLTLVFGIQNVYFTIFKTFTVVSSVMRAGDVLEYFWAEALLGILKSWFSLVLILLPFITFCVFGKAFVLNGKFKFRTALAGLLGAALLFTGTVMGVYINTTGIMSYRYVYFDTFSPILSVPRFGALTTMGLDIQNMIFPEHNKIPAIDLLPKPSDDEPAAEYDDDTENNDDTDIDVVEPEPVSYYPNVLEIDFEALIENETDATIQDMHRYFSELEPTNKNEYTGMFKGKNLIWIVAEGFSSLAIDETHTPTLSKMSREGFVFDNFYNPIWGVSTSDGEYVTLQSLIPKSGVWSFSRSAENYLPFCFGNLMSNDGYLTKAYHNHTYTYYDRDKSHPNMGYDYKGVGNGLDIEVVWPESDVEMIEKTVPEYVEAEPFHVYYLTVSGHMNYNFYGNTMCYRHESEVQDMLDAGYSEAASAYIACQMEFDQSVEYLIAELDKAGVLEDTVIVISGDHYPYGLTIPEIEELYDGEIDEKFELYRSSLIIWNSSMETVHVDKYCSALDIMPTLANLFDLPYDSRLVMGTDILSDSSPLIIFNNRSFITEYGRYDSTVDTFTVNEGMTVPDGYAAEILENVNNKFTYSALILENDYYAKVFLN